MANGLGWKDLSNTGALPYMKEICYSSTLRSNLRPNQLAWSAQWLESSPDPRWNELPPGRLFSRHDWISNVVYYLVYSNERKHLHVNAMVLAKSVLLVNLNTDS